jgi:hypothetical protein
LQDAPAKDLREARNASTNIVPTTTGASIAAAKALPALEGIFGGMSIRVPTPVVSISDFTVITKRDVTIEEVNEVFKKAAADPYYQGILTVTEEELVSSDFIGTSHSAIVDLKLTSVVGGNMLKVLAWYDNEWGYSNRLVELTADVGRLLNQDNENHTDKPEHSAESGADAENHNEFTHGHKPGESFEPSSSAIEKHTEPMLEAPGEAKEELLPAHNEAAHFPEPETLQNHPEPPKPHDQDHF